MYECTLIFLQEQFYKNTRHIFAKKFKNKLKTIPPQQKHKVSNFQLKYSEQTVASAAQLAKCILLHVYSRTTANSRLRENKQILNSLFNSWHNSIFGYKL